MKKLILATTVLALAGMNLQTAKAGDREWATAGKVLTGVAVGAAIVNAIDCGPSHVSVSYSYNAPVYCARPARTVVVTRAPVGYAPPPRVVYVPPRPAVVYRPVAPVRPVLVRTHGRHQEARGYGWHRGHR